MRWLREVKAIATKFDDLSSIPARDKVETGMENSGLPRTHDSKCALTDKINKQVRDTKRLA